jgi:PilZ domain
MDPLELFDDLSPRLGRRHPPRMGVKVTCHSGGPITGPNLALELVNLSDSGARLVLAAPLAVGQPVEAELLAPGWSQPVRREGVVVWGWRRDDETFQAGISFSEPLSPGDLRDLCPTREP